MQTLNIAMPRIMPRADRRNEQRTEPGGMEGNVFRLGRPFMEPDRANQRHPFPELFWMERELPEDEQDRRVNLWQSYNAAAHNIRSARILTQAAANHLTETALMLTLVQTMLDDAIESTDVDFREQVSERIVNVLGNIDASFRGLARVFERTSAVPANQDSDSFVAQVGIHGGQTRTIVINQINTRTLGLGDGNGNISPPEPFEDMRDNVADALSNLRIERMLIFNANSALDSDRSTLDLNIWGNSAVQPGTINPPLGDDATAEEQMHRAEAERAMRMALLRREASNMRTLFEMIELFRS